MNDLQSSRHRISSNWQSHLHEIIFEAETRSGKFFDIALIFFILLSVLIVMLDSLRQINMAYGKILYTLEWIFTVLFTIEYILRLLSVGHPSKYAKSFFGIIDLLSFLPTYFSLLIPGSGRPMVRR